MFMWYTMRVLHMLGYSCIMMHVLDRYHVTLHMIVYIYALLPAWLVNWFGNLVDLLYIGCLVMCIRYCVILVVCFRRYMIVLLTWLYCVYDWIYIVVLVMFIGCTSRLCYGWIVMRVRPWAYYYCAIEHLIHSRGNFSSTTEDLRCR